MRFAKTLAFVVGLAVTVAAYADSVLPSRPRFQAVGVGITAPATSGDLRATRIGVGNAPAGAAGTVTATLFSGSGASLTALNGNNVSAGTVADARLSANIPLLNAASNTFNSGGVATNMVIGNATGANGSSLSMIAGTTTGAINFQTVGVLRGFVGAPGAAGNMTATSVVGDMYLGAQAGRLLFSNDGGTTLNASLTSGTFNAATNVTIGGVSVCRSNGTNCPASLASTSFASVAVFAAGGCGASPTNVSACVRNTTGNYSITLNPGISNARCQVSYDLDSFPAAVVIPMVHTTSFTNVNVRWMNAALAAVDIPFTFTCQF